ncbi:MAG: alpha/beta hydrolase [Candidatus Dormibacteraeota bacterium]|nr:alpha/beta hydrolase [Candidatus Dormibacteraeota bacterium]
MILHGDGDQIVAIGASAMLRLEDRQDATLNVYPGAPHGLMSMHKEQLNSDLLSFLGS